MVRLQERGGSKGHCMSACVTLRTGVDAAMLPEWVHQQMPQHEAGESP